MEKWSREIDTVSTTVDNLAVGLTKKEAVRSAEQFLSPLGAEVDSLWKAFITKTEGHLRTWNSQVLRALEEFEASWRNCIDENFQSSPKGRETSIKLLEECLTPRLENAQAIATKSCEKLVEDQRPVRRLFLLPDRLTDLLRPGYERAVEEKGVGALEKMTKTFENYIREERVFNTLAGEIQEEVEGIQGQFEEMCQTWGQTVAEDIQSHIHGWLKGTEGSMRN
ncbi:hypothetical protein TWF481_002556 [Arthrobotrys musiformis]|uniref:Uncharacterized protein n=1 Tax=Arthrobotrys musiformis TaxID=47236 RepID=A0AAV9VSI6_9PEZI